MCSLLDREKRFVHTLSRKRGRLVACSACPLTERERQVLHRFAQGDDIKQAAVRLSVLPRTAAAHWNRLCRKLGIDKTLATTTLRASSVSKAIIVQLLYAAAAVSTSIGLSVTDIAV